MVMAIFVKNCLILSCILGYHMLLFNRYIFAIFMPFCAFLVKVHKKKIKLVQIYRKRWMHEPFFQL